MATHDPKVSVLSLTCEVDMFRLCSLPFPVLFHKSLYAFASLIFTNIPDTFVFKVDIKMHYVTFILITV
jgi:hypothetical protein